MRSQYAFDVCVWEKIWKHVSEHFDVSDCGYACRWFIEVTGVILKTNAWRCEQYVFFINFFFSSLILNIAIQSTENQRNGIFSLIFCTQVSIHLKTLITDKYLHFCLEWWVKFTTMKTIVFSLCFHSNDYQNGKFNRRQHN